MNGARNGWHARPLPIRATGSRTLTEPPRLDDRVRSAGRLGVRTHVALGLGLAACQREVSVGFAAAVALVHELLEARDEKRRPRLQRQPAGYKLLIIDRLGFVPLSKSGAELLFEICSQRYGRSSTRVISHLAFDEWAEVVGGKREARD